MIIRFSHVIAVLIVAGLTLNSLKSTAGETEQIINETSVATPSVPADHIMLQGLDKITGRVVNLEAKLNSTINFGTLQIKVIKCLKTPPEELPEAVAFLEIHEDKAKNLAHIVFKGWMFSSNPSISALEHPVYDVWVKDCTSSNEVSISTAVSSSAPAMMQRQYDEKTLLPSEQLEHIPEESDEIPLSMEPNSADKTQMDALYEKLEEPSLPQIP